MKKLLILFFMTLIFSINLFATDWSELSNLEKDNMIKSLAEQDKKDLIKRLGISSDKVEKINRDEIKNKNKKEILNEEEEKNIDIIDDLLEKKLEEKKEKEKIAEKEELTLKEIEQKESLENLINKRLKEKEENVFNNIFDKMNQESNKQSNTVKLFGYDMFLNSEALSLPSEISAGKDYILSSGDIVRISLWNDNYSNSFEAEISASGTLFIPEMGAINISSKTISEIQSELQKIGRRKYKELKVDLSLSKMRNINIFVLGEVNSPGTYVLNPLSNILNALYVARGISSNSSLRKVKILRGGETFEIDLYTYLVLGKKTKKMLLAEGDTVFIPSLERKLTILGNVNRPGIYESMKTTTVKDAIQIAGGFNTESYNQEVRIKRIDKDGFKVLTVSNLEDTLINSGDIIQIGSINSKNKNGVYILGNVVRPGLYELRNGETLKSILEKSGGFKKNTYLAKADILRNGEDTTLLNLSFNLKEEDPTLLADDTIYIYNIAEVGVRKHARITGEIKEEGNYEIYSNSRVSDLLFAAQGLKDENVYLNRADLYRLKTDGTMEVIGVNLIKLLQGDKEADIEVKNYDTLKVYSYEELEIKPEIYISGEVRTIGSLKYYKNMTISDAIFYAKGLKISSDKTKIEVVRSLNSGKGLKIGNVDLNSNPNFELKENDLIFVRKIENWEDRKIVEIKGYVKYPGEYAVSNTDSLNSLIIRAGGFREEAFPQGIKFKRVRNFEEDDIELNVDKDEIDIENKKMTRVVNFKYDDKNNKFKDDLFLKSGDQIFIPEKPNSVRVIGEVYRPGLVIFDGKKGISSYVNAAGGYKPSAYKRKAFVIKYNGKTKKNGFLLKVRIEAGDTVVVPNDSREKMGAWEATVKMINIVADTATTALTVQELTNGTN